MVPSIEPLVPRWGAGSTNKKEQNSQANTCGSAQEKTNDKFISSSPLMMTSFCMMGIRIPIVLIALPAHSTSKRPAHCALAHNLPG